MKIRDIVKAKETPKKKSNVKGIAGKHKFNGNFNTEEFLIEKAKRKKLKEKKKKELKEKDTLVG